MATTAVPSSAVIVGGGIIGSGTAYELARRGMPVTLVERGRIGGEASWASAGIISLPHRPWQLPERVELGRLSLEAYPALVETLEEMTGIGIDYRRPGEWAVAVDEEHALEEDAVATWQRSLGLDVEDVSPGEARRREPALPDTLLRARFHPGVGSLSVHRLSQALAAAARQLGATVLEETPVGGILREGERVTGVRLQDRDLRADTTVLASGAWTRLLGDTIGVTLPTLPVKGQLIAFANAPLRPARVISGHGGYVRPRPDGSTMVAATEEYIGFDRRVTGDGVAWLLSLARTLCPVLLEGEIAETWTGLRPGSETNDPLIGPVPGHEGLWVSAGHFRTGAKEGPATATLVAEALTTGQIPELLQAFAPTGQPVRA
ncbi:MAG: FAD-dependent oxidoreductase [Thermomicrobiales bacterium]|nr:FAD-dependent oxidoreductase [Thermomicrobiales bacterium]